VSNDRQDGFGLAKLLPQFLYHAAISVKCRDFHQVRRELERSQFLAPAELDRLRLAKLKELVTYAKVQVPAYREKLRQIDSGSFLSLADIRTLQTVSKQEIKEDFARFLSLEKFPLLTKKTTGGSTGQPVTVWKTREARASELAAMWRGYSWAGIGIGDKQARFWGVPFTRRGRLNARLIDLIGNRRRLSAFSFDQASLAEYTCRLLAFRPDYFYGYASMMCEYADYLQRGPGVRFEGLKAVISTSEVLHESQRAKLENAFGAKVYNEYGCGETGIVAQECERGAMHVVAENMVVEILDGEEVCPPGKPGEITVTELNNRAMPLIRYRLGDFAALAAEPCPCGRTLPVLEKIYGRAYDMIRTADGRTFHGEFFMYIFEELKRQNLGVGKFQVIQQEPSRFLVKIVPEAGYGRRTEEIIASRMREHLGPVMFAIEQVGEISREKSGKMRLIVACRDSAREGDGRS
jgi:phenylacetate-CoA ligase